MPIKKPGMKKPTMKKPAAKPVPKVQEEELPEEEELEQEEDELVEEEVEEQEEEEEQEAPAPKKKAAPKKPVGKKLGGKKPATPAAKKATKKPAPVKKAKAAESEEDEEPMSVSSFRNPKSIPQKTRAKAGTPTLPEEGKLLPKDTMLALFVQHCSELEEGHPLHGITTKTEAEAVLGSVNDFLFGNVLQKYNVRLFTNETEVPVVTIRREEINDKIVRNPSSTDYPYNRITGRVVLRIGNAGQSYRLNNGESEQLTQEDYEALVDEE